MAQQQKGDSFSTFLRSVRKYQAARGGETSVLGAFGQEASLSIEQLRGRVKLSMVEFSQILEGLQKDGFVVVEGSPGQEVVRLTAAGKIVAQQGG